jgi:hypothetical protein
MIKILVSAYAVGLLLLAGLFVVESFTSAYEEAMFDRMHATVNAP